MNETQPAIDVINASSSSPYTFGSDGYLELDASLAQGNHMYGYLYGATTLNVIKIGAYNDCNVIYVKKGMRFYLANKVGTSLHARFIALS